MKLTVTFTLPGDLAGNAANNGSLAGATDSLRPVANGDPNGIRTRVAGMKTRCPRPD